MRVTFLGTAAARPTVSRNVSSLVVQREGEHLMFDCGEGTQRQMMRFGTGFAIDDIFFTHLHADHFLGVTGLLRTMGLQAREEPIRLWVPTGGERVIRAAINLGVERIPFEVQVTELGPADSVDRGEYLVQPYPASHGGTCFGYAIIERTRLGRFNPERARELGVPEGPAWGRLHKGEPVTVDGKTIEASDVVGSPRPGRKVVYSGDSRPTRETIEIAASADLLIHEATFGQEEKDRAVQTGHSTAREAARVARDASALRLYLTHFSPRYSDDPRLIEREARKVYPGAIAAYDGLVVEVPYRDE